MADAVEALPPPPEHGGVGGGLESGLSSPSPTASPEFEFWMMGKNPSSFPAPDLLTADELFSGGVVLPLHTLQAAPVDGDGDGPTVGGGDEAAGEEGSGSDSAALAPPADAEEEGEPAQPPLAESGITPTPDLPAVTFKWKDIFKAGGGGGGGEAKERKKMERRVSSVSGNAELININIWPFSRSRSAGHSAGAAGTLSRANKPNPPNANGSVTSNGAAPASTAVQSGAAPAAPAPPAARKVSSAPCSRSNSRGESGPEPVVVIPAAAAAAVLEGAAAAGQQQAAPVAGTTSMLRRLVPGHGRNNNNTGAGGGGASGIRLGRPSPVWQLRRNKLQQTAAEQKQAGAKKKAAAPAVVAAAASSDDKEAAAPPSVSAPAAGCRNNAEGGEEGPNPPQGLFGLRTFFSKKVY